jgi:hypothetical protein
MKKSLVILFIVLNLLVLSCQKVLDASEPMDVTPMVGSTDRGVVSPGLEYHYNHLFDEVRLVFAQPFSYAVSGMSFYRSIFRVHVKNLGTEASRRVYIHYSTGGPWQDLELTLLGDYGTHSVYTGQMTPTYLDFAVRYETDAGVWWDNNDGADYAITTWTSNGDHQPGYAGGGVGLLYANAELVTFGGGNTGWRVRGRMVVDTKKIPVTYHNGSYLTNIGVHIQDEGYGAGSWSTFWHNDFVYSMTGAPHLYVFDFESDPIDQTGSGNSMDGELEFVIFGYDPDGSVSHVYWDNNFDNDYILPKVDGAMIQ